jgi:predicted AlkP superfamily pyrophosphatase or phosphodiesterase
MSPVVCLLSIPGLSPRYAAQMPSLRRWSEQGGQAALIPSFPAVTCPVQANMTTGALPRDHGVVANGFYWRDQAKVEMWTAWNDCIERPQIWDVLHERDPGLTSAVWFPLHSKGCGADTICTFAPIHNPDGTESLWCYTRPELMYGDLRDTFGHFPLKHFWGPFAGVQSTEWIVSSAIWCAERYKQRFWYIYLPHLDYATQKFGPESPQAQQAVVELGKEVSRLEQGFLAAYGTEPITWLAASEYTVVPVNHVLYPNRILRELDLLSLDLVDGAELLNVPASPAWALADHQVSNVFVKDKDPRTIERIVARFRREPGIAEVLHGDELAKYALDHPRSGEVVLVSQPNSWQAYYWWNDNTLAPRFAHTVDIHRKPGYDPAEMFLDPATKGISLDPTLVKGSHGAPATSAEQHGVLVCSQPGVLKGTRYVDCDVAALVIHQFDATAVG